MQHVLTQAVGGPSPELDGDLYHVMVRNDDRILLCSDGLTDMMSEEEIAETLAAQAASEDACRALVDQVLECGARDNVTVIVARYSIG
jgi:protein phosphatase